MVAAQESNSEMLSWSLCWYVHQSSPVERDTFTLEYKHFLWGEEKISSFIALNVCKELGRVGGWGVVRL